MGQDRLLQLAQELERLGTEECFYYLQATGPAIRQFLNKQQELLITAEKMQRELAGEIRYNPARLMGIDYPITEELEAISGMMAGVEEIKQSAVDSVDELPARTEMLSKVLQGRFFRVIQA
jgi:hypothetical protein